ncbi:YfiR family protein [Hydrogenophaga sp. A37]|uniref:YfiR family protein n=1 Tax=Hydrogenophaga sp. A37 TaxID=1945864 RepID=UPI0009867733|nr:YfiR family protein [Hydrogenophaga sp. A37]OOG88668.1 hypothetical protein B0E41_01615 [Hydrogenophaga sp. A37]
MSSLVTLTVWPRRALAGTDFNSTDKGLAAYLHKLMGYIEWPSVAFADAGSPITVGVVGAPDMHESLTRLLSGRPVQGRAVEVQALRWTDDLSNIHLLYVGAAAWAGRAQWMGEPRERPPVIVTDAPGGVDQGATIGFVSGERVRIEASLPAADGAGVKLSSRLLAMAVRVVERRH